MSVVRKVVGVGAAVVVVGGALWWLSREEDGAEVGEDLEEDLTDIVKATTLKKKSKKKKKKEEEEEEEGEGEETTTPMTKESSSEFATASPSSSPAVDDTPPSCAGVSVTNRTPLKELIAALDASHCSSLVVEQALRVTMTHTTTVKLRDVLLTLGVMDKLLALLHRPEMKLRMEACRVLGNFIGCAPGHRAALEAGGVEQIVTLLMPSLTPESVPLVLTVLKCCKNLAMLDAGSKELLECGAVPLLAELAECLEQSVSEQAVQVILNVSCYGPSAPFLALSFPLILQHFAFSVPESGASLSYPTALNLARVSHTLTKHPTAIGVLNDSPAPRAITALVVALMASPPPAYFTGERSDGVTAIQAFSASLKNLAEHTGGDPREETAAILQRVRKVSAAASSTSTTAD